MIEDRPEVLTPEQVADWLKLRPSTVRAMAREGRLPSLMIGKNRRFIEGDVRAWLDRQRDAA